MLVLDGGEWLIMFVSDTRLTVVWLQYLKHFFNRVYVYLFFVQVASGWDSNIPLHLDDTQCGIKLKVFIHFNI